MKTPVLFALRAASLFVPALAHPNLLPAGILAVLALACAGCHESGAAPSDTTCQSIGDAGVVMLAGGQGEVSALAVDATHVYWSTYPQAGILATPLACDAPSPLVPAPVNASAMTLDATRVYWNDGYNVFAASLADGTVTKLGSSDVDPSSLQGVVPGIAVDATNVYWTSFGGPVLKVPLEGGTPTTLAPPQKPGSIVVDAKYAYWTNEVPSAVMRVPLDGGAVVTLASTAAQPEGPIAVDATSAYWPSWDGNGGALILKVPLDGGTPTTLAAGSWGGQIFGFAVDATSAYWTNSTGNTVMKVSLDGGTPTTLVAFTNGEEDGPGPLAVDATHVYWGTGDAVFAMPK